MSSETLGWQPLLVEEFQQPPGGTDLPEAWAGHSIALCLAPRPHIGAETSFAQAVMPNY
jgi:AraC family transcriptional regulator